MSLCMRFASFPAKSGLRLIAEGGAATADQSAFVSSTHRPAAGIYSQKSKKVRNPLHESRLRGLLRDIASCL